MAKTSITPEVETPEALTARHLPATQAPAQLAGYNPDHYDDPNRDIQTPTLGLINKIGPLSKAFPKNAGEFALGDQLVLGETVTAVCVGKQKLYVESRRGGVDLKFGDGIMPRMFASANEAFQAGYAVDFDSNRPNRVEEAAKLAFLIRAPQGDSSGEFYYVAPDGSKWAVVQTTVRRGGYRGVYRPINTRASRPNEKLYATFWTISAEHVENTQKKQDWFEMRAKQAGPVDEKTVAWIEQTLGERLDK
jgi:hypothetical protein